MNFIFNHNRDNLHSVALGRKQGIILDVNESIEELSNIEFNFIQTIFLSNILHFLKIADDDDLKDITILFENFNMYQGYKENGQINNEILSATIEEETNLFRDFLIKFYNYKEGE